MKKTGIQAILFDLDGTLIDSSFDLMTSVNLMLAQYNLQPISYRQCIQFVGDGIPKLVNRALGASVHQNPNAETEPEFLCQAVTLFRENYAKHLVDHTRLYPSVSETLSKLCDFKLAVISNKSYDFSVEILTRLQILDLFDLILGGDSLVEKKPSPQPILYALEKFNVSPNKALMVGDGENDILAGKSAGIMTCGVTYGFRSKTDIVALRPDFTIGKFYELLSIHCLFE
ncbi:MAG: phosphoglycolate phosphatase [Candidatus Marinimicrobia bacterium]|nr:phosphoglycolate phosphatase [Candidatus Neomarinimicrobiota bacterium]